MRILSLIIVGLCLAVAGVVLFREAGLTGDSAIPAASATEIRVSGPGNTLAALAAAYGRPDLLTYNPQTRTATSHATLVVEGELVLGRENDRSSGETLQFDTQVCGDMRLEVRSGGVLRLYHSTVQTVSQVLSLGACSRGYAFFVDGELVMKDSHISYISGSTSECLRGKAKATLCRSIFSYCDGSALNCVEVDGARIRIEDCDFRGSGNWGVIVQGRGGEPLEIRRSLLDARVGALLATGQSASVRLTDCAFDPAKLVFSHDSGDVQIAWTRRVLVLDRQTRAPIAGASVRACCESHGSGTAIVEARTNDQGLAELVLLERVARPGERGGTGGPLQYRLSVRRPGGEWQDGRGAFTVRGKDAQPVVLTAS